jgi:hypothetical protein
LQHRPNDQCGLLQNNQLIFISKAKEQYQLSTTIWLKKYDLDNVPIFFSSSYEEKNKIALEQKVDYMIDDKIPVLRSMDTNIKKIWFCTDIKKIFGLAKFELQFFNSLIVAKNWYEVTSVFDL